MIQQPFPGGNNGGDEIWPQPPLNNDNHDSNTNPKRPRNYENSHNPQKSTALAQKVNPSTAPINRGTTHIFYKTRICQKFLDGKCRNGDNCTFAHGPNDLREPPPNWQELVKDNRGSGSNWDDDQKIIHRMKICRKFYNGEECPYGEKCNFLHESPAKFKAELAMEMGRSRESSVINIQTVGSNVDRWIRGGQSGQSQTEIGQHLNNSSDAIRVSTVSVDQDSSRASEKASFWKTRICSKWETTGQCPFAERCHFAHGHSELMHASVGRVEGEAPEGPTTEVQLTDAPMAVPVQQGEARGFAKLKLAHKKLNRIYADWIDDEEDEQVSSSKID